MNKNTMIEIKLIVVIHVIKFNVQERLMKSKQA